MSERGIIFSTPLVPKVMDGTKWQTRRLPGPTNSLVDGERVSPATWKRFGLDFSTAWVGKGPSPAGNPGPYLHVKARGDGFDDAVRRVYPDLSTGDRLWVREAWGVEHTTTLETKQLSQVCYRATDKGFYREYQLWRPSIHMPKWASRITLELTDVRVQRLQDISEEDARAEGCTGRERTADDDTVYVRKGYSAKPSPQAHFQSLWDAINGKRAAWASNPWVWALSFKRVA